VGARVTGTGVIALPWTVATQYDALAQRFVHSSLIWGFIARVRQR
jgi:hypothetical protein